MKNCLLTICSSLLLIAGAASASAQEVWFAPPDNMDRGARTFNHDFPQLFESQPAWDGKSDVFVLSPKFTAEASEEDTKRVTSWLAAHHIALAVGAGTVQTDNAQPVEGECGYGVEGYTRPNKNQIIFSRLKRRGGTSPGMPTGRGSAAAARTAAPRLR